MMVKLPITTSEPERGGSQGRAAVVCGAFSERSEPLTAAAAEAIGASGVLIGSNPDRECSRGAKQRCDGCGFRQRQLVQSLFQQ